ncbi:MAG: HD domain-containing protein [Candidatus Melainabacteria bacterium]|nr:HD domain-containing protein [Candidatus Melainabacteria bacterium]
MEKDIEQQGKKALKNPNHSDFEGINLVKKNGKTDNNKSLNPSIKPTNVEGHYPRFMLHGAVNLLQEDLRELSIILESFVPHLDKIGIEIRQTNPLIKEIITGTEIFRRLKGISQVELLPFAFKQVPWFTRYTHSCLTYAFGDHVINKLQSKLNFNAADLDAAKLCFLIHDLGHGPFSHLTERAFKKPRGRGGKIPKEYDHEYWTKILLNELKDQLFDTNNNPYIQKKTSTEEKYRLDVFSSAVQIISKDHKNIFVQLLSSQIDLDRLSNYLGDRIVVNAILEEEGDIKNEKMVKALSSINEVVDNIKRILNSFVVLDRDESANKCEPYLAIHEDAANPIMHYLLDRHIIRYYLLKHYRRESANNVLEKILLRAQYLVRNNELASLGRTDLLIQTWLFGNHTEAEFVEMDDQLVFNQIRKWGKHTNDPILHDLTLRFTAHHFFCSYSCEKNNKPAKPNQELINSIKTKVNNELNTDITMYPKELITDYYFTYDETTSKPYHTDSDEVMIYTSEKKIKKLSSYIKDTKSELGYLLLNSEFERYLFIVPPEVEL